MYFDPRLVQRLNRPLKRPGVINHRMADGLLERFQGLTNRLPLLDEQLSRWSTVVEFDVEQVPIVYAQNSELDDQKVDNFQGSLDVQIKGRSPDSNDVKNLKISNNQISTPHGLSTEDITAVTIKPIATEVDTASDTMPVVQQEILSTSTTPMMAIAPEIAPVMMSAVDMPILQAQRESETTINKLDSASENSKKFTQPKSKQTKKKGRSPDSNHVKNSAIPSNLTTEQQTLENPIPEPRTADLMITPIATEVDTAADTMPVVQQEILSTSTTPMMAIAPEIAPVMMSAVDMPILQAQRESEATINEQSLESENPRKLTQSNSKQTKKKGRSPDSDSLKNSEMQQTSENLISENREDIIVNQIATEVNLAADTMPVVQQGILSSPTQMMAIAPEIAPVMMSAVDMPIIQAQRDSRITINELTSASENPQKLTQPKSKQTKKKGRSPDSNRAKKSEISSHSTTEQQTLENSRLEPRTADVIVNLLATEVNLTADTMPVVQQEILSNQADPVMAIAPEIVPVMMSTVDMPIIQAQRQSGTTINELSLESENPKKLTQPNSKQTEKKGRSPDSNSLKNSEIKLTSENRILDSRTDAIVNPIATEINSAVDVMPVVQQDILSNPTQMMAIAPEIMPITINAVGESVIQAKEDLSVKARPQIMPETPPPTLQTVADLGSVSVEHREIFTPTTDFVSEAISFTPTALSSEQKLPFIQIQQDSNSAPLDKELFTPSEPFQKTSILLTEIKQNNQTSNQTFDHDQTPIIPILNNPSTLSSSSEPLQKTEILLTETKQDNQTSNQTFDHDQTPIIPILNNPFTLSSEPLSFATPSPSEVSDHQLPASQVKQINTKHPEAITEIVSDSQQAPQPLVIKPVSEGIIQARYDTAAPSIVNVQPLISTVSDAPVIPLPFEAIAPIENLPNLAPIMLDSPITKAPWSDSSPEVLGFQLTSSENFQIPMPVVHADPIESKNSSSTFNSEPLVNTSKIDSSPTQIFRDPLVQSITQEPSIFDQTNSDFSTVQTTFITHNIDNITEENTIENTMPISTHKNLLSQDQLIFSPSNQTPTNEARVMITPIIQKTTKITNSAPITEPQKQLNSSPINTPIVREKKSNTNSLQPFLVMETSKNPQSILPSANSNSAKLSLHQSSISPIVRASIEISEQTFEPLLLSRHNSTNSTSEMTGNPLNQSQSQSYANSRAIANTHNLITYPTSNSSNQTNTSTQLSTKTNHVNQDSNTLMTTQNPPEVKETKEINMDLLVAQVERKIIKRLIIEGERRGKRKWL